MRASDCRVGVFNNSRSLAIHNISELFLSTQDSFWGVFLVDLPSCPASAGTPYWPGRVPQHDFSSRRDIFRKGDACDQKTVIKPTAVEIVECLLSRRM